MPLTSAGQVADPDAEPSTGSQPSFGELGVNPALVEALRLRSILAPFAIQSLVVPDGLAGRDLLGRAPTGSGKTLAFGIPALHRLAELEPSAKKRPRSLILSPTRELAEQIAQELEPLAKHLDRSVLAVYGGVPILRHIKALSRGVDLLVACPGRLLDLVQQGAVHLDDVEIAIVDEADRMADMGFLPDVKKLLDLTSKPSRQTLLFSATLDKEVRVLIDRYQHDPVVHEVGDPEPDLSLMTHRFIRVPKAERIPLAADVIAEYGSTVVFVRTRHGVDKVARQLRQQGVSSGHIHGGRSQSQRDRALQVFVDGKVQALVATDVAARGIHVDGVACVLHYDPPADQKDYVHRSGRTARAGASGIVVSFLDKAQIRDSLKMQESLGIEADVEATPPRAERDRTPVVTGADRQRERSSGPAKKAKGRPAKRTGDRPARAETPKAPSSTGKPSTARKAAAKKSTGKPNAQRAKAKRLAEGETGKPKRNARKAAAAASKRSGKPRPKNRKNKPSRRKRS